MTQDLVWLEPKTPHEIVDEAINKYNIDSLYVLYSGGMDSNCVADFISTNYPKYFKGCVFTVTGIGAAQTRKFVIKYCKERNWPLFFTWPKNEHNYYNFVMRDGFPSPPYHRKVMAYLKYHTWWRFCKEAHSKGEKMAFISGVRKKESWARDKRRLYTKSPTDKDGKLIFIKPFLYKNGTQLYQYFAKHDLQKSPVYEWFDKSGECYCGSFAQEWELKMLEKFDPLAFESIKWLEKQVRLKGSKKAQKHPTWGGGFTTALDVEAQNTLDTFFTDMPTVNEDYCGESCDTGQ